MKNILEIGSACVGCRSCELSCPQSCITFLEDKEGFLYPNIDENKCINCGKCINACPINNKDKQEHNVICAYALKNNDKERLLKSASGGASDIFAQYILKENGVVFGCAYDDNMRVHHIMVTNTDELWKIQSSKYVQSDLEDSYIKVKKCLENDKKVLFTGTPCQIGGLYSFLENKEYDKLYTMDLICHGVPSPRFFARYIEYLAKKMGGKILHYNFRSKDKLGWGPYILNVKTEKKTKTNYLELDKFGNAFLNGIDYRESCYLCKYANINRVADITIGDFWGINSTNSKIYSKDGVSVVLVNTDKGRKLLHIENVEYEQVEFDDALKYQRNLKGPTIRPFSRDIFYNKLYNEKFIEKLKIEKAFRTRLRIYMPKLFLLLKRITKK